MVTEDWTWQRLKKHDIANRSPPALDSNEFASLYRDLLRGILDLTGSHSRDGARREFFVNKRAGLVQDYYTLEKELGRGSFGVVYLVRSGPPGQEVHRVVKFVQKDAAKNMTPQQIEAEIMTLVSLDHPHIVRVYEYFEDRQYVAIVQDCCAGGDLTETVLANVQKGNPVGEGWLREFAKQVASAVAYCHERRIIHKDLKPDNIMLLANETTAISAHQTLASLNARPHVVVIDFGVSEMFTPGENSAELGGTPLYMAPEVWLQKHGPKCDIWSIGVILFQLLSGALPFLPTDQQCRLPIQQQKRVWVELAHRGPNWHHLSRASPEAQQVVKDCLAFDDLKRPSAVQMQQRPWFASTQDSVLGEEHLEALRNFNKRSRFEKFVLTAVAAQVPASAIGEIKRAFAEADENNNGLVDKRETQEVLRRLGCQDNTLCDQIFDALDQDGSGTLSYSEFVAAVMGNMKSLLNENLWAAFRELDRNGDGKLSMQEIAGVMRCDKFKGLGLGANLDVEQVMKELDADQSGCVSFDEFAAYFMRSA